MAGCIYQGLVGGGRGHNGNHGCGWACCDGGRWGEGCSDGGEWDCRDGGESDCTVVMVVGGGIMVGRSIMVGEGIMVGGGQG